MTNTYCHARSLDSLIDSEDRRWVETLRTFKIAGNIPDTYRIVGENLFYRHTCKYENLDSLFQVFAIIDNDLFLDWNSINEISNKLGLTTVPEFYRGIYDKDVIMESFNNYVKNSKDDVEGFVIRTIDSFDEKDFKWNVSKFVRKNFKIGSSHWRHEKKIINGLKSGEIPWNFK